MLQTMNEKSLELAVVTQVAVTDLMERMRDRLEDEEGQTSAEYLGIILVVVAIIGGIAASGIGGKITTAIGNAIDSIKAG